MNNILIQKMQHSEISEVAEILTDAFETNPAYSIILKKESQRRGGLSWLFKTSLILNNHRQILTQVIKEKDTGKIIGTFTLLPPHGVTTGISIYLKIGIPYFITKFGVKSFIRMMSLDNCNKLTLAKSMKSSGYHYLSMVVIKEEYRGRGIGSYALKQAVKELASSASGCNLLGLTTQLPENVLFYSRLGFCQLDEGYIDFKGDRYYNYTMKLNVGHER